AILTRADVPDADRMVALGDLAKSRNQTLVEVLMLELESALKQSKAPDSSYKSPVNTLARLLPYQIPEKLKPVRDRLVEFSTSDFSADLRQSAWAALALADDSFENVWSKAAAKSATLAELLMGIPLLPDPSFRAKAYDRVKLLVSGSASDSIRRAAIRAIT